MNPKLPIILSIIIPIYNVEKYLEKCLSSIVGNFLPVSCQTEVILIDDGSTDSSGAIAERFAGEHSWIKIIHKPNAGVAAARNQGIQAASGEWIYFVDSDDWLADNAVAGIFDCIRQYPDADVILFDAYQNAGKKQTSWEHFEEEKIICTSSDLLSLQRETLYFHKTPLAAPWDKIYRRDFLLQNHIEFQENLKVLDDMVFNVEVFGSAKKVVYRKDKIYHYRHVPVSITNSYKPDRVEQDKKVWNYLEQYMFTHMHKYDTNVINAGDDLRQAYFCRIVKSFSICCRLCFFNKENKRSLREKTAYLREVYMQPPYKEAFDNVRLNDIEWKLKIVVFMVRNDLSYGIYMLHLFESFTRIWRQKA